jgi:hypothetical protein
MATGNAGGRDSDDKSQDHYMSEEDEDHIPDTIQAAMEKLEVQMGLEGNTLKKAVVVLDSDNMFDEEEVS